MIINSNIEYNKDTGEITNKEEGRPKERSRYFKSSSQHYKSIYVDGVDYLSHRLAFYLVTGEFPSRHVDHINGNGLDNRWANLREVTQAENNLNKKVYSCNTTGVSGVTVRDGKFRARIRYQGVLHNIGTYKTLMEAKAARELKEREFGFHKNHGRR